MEKSAVSDRLREFVKSLGLSNLAFEKECGLYNGYVKDIGTRVEVEKLGAILLKFPQLNLNWLLAGQGKMTNESIGTTAQSPLTFQSEKNTIFIGNWEGMADVVRNVLSEMK